MNSNWIILSAVFLIQLTILILGLLTANKIRQLFSPNIKDYSIETNDGVVCIKVSYSSRYLTEICKEINMYLSNHYSSKKSVDIDQINVLVNNRATIYDGIANFIGTVPVLIGLAGTVLGMYFAFNDYASSTESSDFITLISKSSSIAFLGTLSGIFSTIVCNFFNSYWKRIRDIRLNSFLSFLDLNLSPKLPTLKDETVALIANSMQSFGESYFAQFEKYTDQFKKINAELDLFYRIGLKEIIERNSLNLEKLDLYIDKLDNLQDVTKGITFKPIIVTQFSNAASELVQKIENVSISLKETMEKQEASNKNVNQILNAYEKLEERVHKNIIDLTADKQIFGDYGNAITQFFDDSKKKLEKFAEHSETLGSSIETLSIDYKHIFGTLCDNITKQIKDNISSEGFDSLSKTISTIEGSLANELKRIEALAFGLQDLASKISNGLVPAFQESTRTVAATNIILSDGLPKAMADTVETNRSMVITASEKMMKEPKSWGQWTFGMAKRLFGKRSKSKNERRKQ